MVFGGKGVVVMEGIGVVIGGGLDLEIDLLQSALLNNSAIVDIDVSKFDATRSDDFLEACRACVVFAARTWRHEGETQEVRHRSGVVC